MTLFEIIADQRLETGTFGIIDGIDMVLGIAAHRDALALYKHEQPFLPGLATLPGKTLQICRSRLRAVSLDRPCSSSNALSVSALGQYLL